MSSGLATRVLTGLVLAPMVVLAIVFLPAPAFALLVSVLMLAGYWEWTRLAGMSGRPLRAAALAVLAAGFAALALGDGARPLLVLAWVACGFWLLALGWLRRPRLGPAAAPARSCSRSPPAPCCCRAPGPARSWSASTCRRVRPG